MLYNKHNYQTSHIYSDLLKYNKSQTYLLIRSLFIGMEGGGEL